MLFLSQEIQQDLHHRMVYHHNKRGEIGFISQIDSLPKSIKRAALLAFVYVMGWGLISAFTPIYYEEILGNYSNFGVAMFMFYIFSFLFSFVLGGVLDKIQPRRLLMVALLLYVPMGFLLLQLTAMWNFMLFVFYHALASTLLWLSLEYYVRKHSPKNKEMLSYGLYDAGWVAAMVTGSVLGGYLISLWGYNLFYSVSIFSFIALFVLAFLPDKKKGTIRDGVKGIGLASFKRELKDFFKNKELRGFFVSIFLLKFCHGFLPLMLPLFFREINASFFVIGVLFALLYLPAFFEPVYASILKKKRVVMLGLIVSIGALLVMFFVQSLWLLFILIIVIAIPFSMILVIFQGRITQLMPKKKVGEMTAILLALTNIALGLGPLTAGLLADNYGINSMFLLGSCLFLIIFIYNLKKKF